MTAVIDSMDREFYFMNETREQLPQLLNQLNNQIGELESLMQRLHFSLGELTHSSINEFQSAHPEISQPLYDAEILSFSRRFESSESQLARILHC